MKKIAAILFLLAISVSNAQEVKPTYEKSGDLVKATYYFEDGTIKEQGFFKDAKLTGTWISYNKKGEKTMVGNYLAGVKVGKWLAWNNSSLREINYANNTIVSVKELEDEPRLAYND